MRGIGYEGERCSMIKLLNELREWVSLALVIIAVFLFSIHIVADAIFYLVLALWITPENKTLWNSLWKDFGLSNGGNMRDPGHPNIKRKL